ncbi:hypothetical protein L1987_29388 [Smallanthus sonchifolius]|uniref:Uncharacterized protein n=1 Tax=Smallanthus sonchifolius TaxID=185202 RepID=A0ACB9HZT6_9ASTR|nr:hypothetical protein L1987_29388 [Smallanthus sonchifolius]
MRQIADGVKLLKHMTQKGRLGDQEAASVMRQITEGVKLLKHMKQKGRLGDQEAASVMRHIAEGVKLLKRMTQKGRFGDQEAASVMRPIAEGVKLLKHMTQKSRLGDQEAASVMRQIAEGVKFCHKKGVMHRDLKPDNLMFVDDKKTSTLKLIDFGMSIKFRSGTLPYNAPEVNEKKYGPESDIWSAGAILYALLYGTSF